MDTVPGDKIPDTKLDQSTISRFACRILCERNNPTVARVYAAGFDSSKNIFLGVSVPLESHVERVAIVHLNQEKACKWQENDNEIDGQTTNGVLLMHPRGVFHGGEATMGPWVETSVGGMIFMRRESRSSQQRGEIIESESNQLQDGTLIDLCGATLLWRSAEGLEKSPVRLRLGIISLG
ncbi:protein pellino [Dendroctonus ponderosae]|uniref:Protein pellino n=1 Tax=Dendroctonus ponderosae TaxID=77166 RepID=N6TPI9_DENPD|nr:protein pellino [Dendroctonus ponderosae]